MERAAAEPDRRSSAYNQPLALEFAKPVPATQPYSQPYWLVKPPYRRRLHGRRSDARSGFPTRRRSRECVCGSRSTALRSSWSGRCTTAMPDRAEGERERPLLVVPPVAVNLPESVAIFPTAATRKVHVAVHANIAKASGDAAPRRAAGMEGRAAARSHSRSRSAGEQQELTFDVTPPAGETTASLRAVATVGGREIASGMQRDRLSAYPDADAVPARPISSWCAPNIQVTAHKVGYIMGAGDEMPDALRQLGLDVTLLIAIRPGAGRSRPVRRHRGGRSRVQRAARMCAPTSRG